MDLYQAMQVRDEIHRECEERLILELSMAERALGEAQIEPVNQQRLSHLERIVAGLKKDIRVERYSFWKDTWEARRLLWGVREEVQRS